MSRRDDRCPPVPLETLRRIPSGTCKLFVLAAAEGRSMNPRGTFDRLLRGERPIGVRVAPIHRDRVLAEAGVKLRQWQDATKGWVALELAHRCQRGRVFLLVQPAVADVCPDCEARLERVSTRSQVVADAQSERPTFVQTREPSTGTQEGERASSPGITPEKALELIQKFGSAHSARSNESQAAG